MTEALPAAAQSGVSAYHQHMAEVRKVRPGKGGHIAQAIAKAMGESARPITPGGSPDPSKASDAGQSPHAVTASSFLLSEEFLLPAASDTAEPEDEKRSDS